MKLSSDKKLSSERDPKRCKTYRKLLEYGIDIENECREHKFNCKMCKDMLRSL